MYGRKETLYDVLDLPRDADTAAVAIAHKRARAELNRETAAPDSRRASLLHEAYEVLSDPQRRAAYDASLDVDNAFVLPGGRPVRPRLAGLFAALVVAGAAAFFTLHRPSPTPPQPGTRSSDEILAMASFSVGYVQSIDISGHGTPVGLAVAIDEGVMVTTCHGLAAGAQLVVHLVGRVAPARVAMADEERDLCKLSVEGAGSRPLPLRAEAPRAGDKVYAVTFGNEGQVVREATIKGTIPTPKGNVIEVSIAIAPLASGGPLLDTAGRLVGIMTSSQTYGAGRNVALPGVWLNNPRWLSR